MFQLLHQYLIENSNLHLPGIGTLAFAEVPARLDVADKQLQAPYKTLRLHSDTHSQNKHALMGFLSRQLDISEEQSYSVFQQFAASINTSLATKRILYWDNLGAFQKDETGTVQFVQTSDLDQYLPPVSAMKIIRQKAEHTITVGDTETTNTAMQEFYEEPEMEQAPELDFESELELAPELVEKTYWWIWAIVIFAVGAGLIWFKHFS